MIRALATDQRPLSVFLDMLFGAEPPSGYAELRWKVPTGMGQEFVRLDDRGRLAVLIAAHGTATDLYIGVAPRTRPEGGRQAVDRAHVLWVDCDTPESVENVKRFDPPPSCVIRSGSGGVHAYWPVWPPIEADDLQRANRRLAHHLGADLVVTDPPRILRPPGTLNFKHSPPKRVTVARLEPAVFEARQVVGALPDPPGRVRDPGRPRVELNPDDPLQSIPPAVYVELLTGQQVGPNGKIVCPFHQEGDPSLHVYGPGQGWWCFGACDRGGSIIDFGAALYGIEPRGQGFHDIRRRLAADLLAGQVAA